jgi:hypothetical protein
MHFMQKSVPANGLTAKHLELLSKYGPDILKQVEKAANLRKHMADASQELLRIGTTLHDQRLLAIADQYARGVSYLPPIEFGEPWGWKQSQERLKEDRDRMDPRVRKRLERLESPKCRPIEWFEEWRARRARTREQYRTLIDPADAEKRAKEEVPFAELKDERLRRSCFEVFGKRKDPRGVLKGERRVREVLRKYYCLSSTSREYLSLRLAVEERCEREIRESRQDLWTVLRGVREVTARAAGLGAPEDVRVCLQAWQARARDAHNSQDPFYPPSRSVIEERNVIAQGNRLVRAPTRPTTPKFRDGRRNVESHLLRDAQLTPRDIAILETAWLLPVEGDREEAMVPLTPESAANRAGKTRPDYPTRPRLDNTMAATVNAARVKKFYDQTTQAIKDLRKKLRREAARGRRVRDA